MTNSGAGVGDVVTPGRQAALPAACTPAQPAARAVCGRLPAGPPGYSSLATSLTTAYLALG
ncbi:hypothetical protein [Candidatus Amarolinea dominans]|uniref:hypothetical protein n=1 Tax=Candidatus Amarolinea dominans TaxID=3140696 RepID=UPI001D2A1A01|nr:hypothetical protein [Anaerolineae bacterium]